MNGIMGRGSGDSAGVTLTSLGTLRLIAPFYKKHSRGHAYHQHLDSIMSSTLCLTCASTITQKSLEAGDVHQTKCCERYICAPCQSRNPRLRAYDPCLACLGGVSATSSSSKTSGMAASGPPKQLAVRGGASDGDITVKTGLEVNDVLENDMFTIGDDEDDGEEEQSPSRLDCEAEKDLPPPPPYSTEDSNTTTYEPPLASEAISSAPSSSAVPATISSSPSSSPSLSTAGQEASLQTTASSSDPRKYYIEPGDTLSGISLKLGVDVSTPFSSSAINLTSFLSPPTRVAGWHA
ncbi:hypothetical protein DL93DRAFT_1511873 [Clavulina sp. PMI_390]|nr:hypothetical protein DL93DRAFT_1511873 [Clavulina sp. PMI_390]